MTKNRYFKVWKRVGGVAPLTNRTCSTNRTAERTNSTSRPGEQSANTSRTVESRQSPKVEFRNAFVSKQINAQAPTRRQPAFKLDIEVDQLLSKISDSERKIDRLFNSIEPCTDRRRPSTKRLPKRSNKENSDVSKVLSPKVTVSKRKSSTKPRKRAVSAKGVKRPTSSRFV
jgi:hypothetical protein